MLILLLALLAGAMVLQEHVNKTALEKKWKCQVVRTKGREPRAMEQTIQMKAKEERRRGIQHIWG